jgi:hypothetical protein
LPVDWRGLNMGSDKIYGIDQWRVISWLELLFEGNSIAF